jgi:cellulose synthase/poly-beta-1,6-N-acetylglucosamine synthase-like glycosyltransferase
MGGGWITFYAVAQILYFLSFITIFYFLVLPVDWVEVPKTLERPDAALPLIVMAYPVLREDVPTMTSTLVSLSWLQYPRSRYRIIAIPNSDDHDMIVALRQLQERFEFLEVMEVPRTSDPSWDVVWRAWGANPKAYWFHQGTTLGRRDLPPKKTLQLVYLFYRLVEQIGTDWVLDYIDADSMPPPNHFRAAAAGLEHYDVVQATNVAGNLLDSMPASLHAFDHMCWDGYLHPHMSAHGRHPYYVLGKGQFYRAGDLMELGCFNPWIAIEDPEVGIRLWANGRRLGIVSDPLKEEVPRTIVRGIIQRKRWMCGFFQTLGRPLKQMGLPFWRRMQARLNIVAVLSLPVNAFGLPTGAYALYLYIFRAGFRQEFWLIALAVVNIALYFVLLAIIYANAWRRTRLVLDRTRSRVWYMLRVNPLSLFIYHTIWTVPIVIGFVTFVADRGKVWVRTQKFDRLRRFVEDGRED